MAKEEKKIKPYFDSILLYCLIKEFQTIKGEKLKSLKKDNENNIYLIFQRVTFLASTHPSFYRVLLLTKKEKKTLQKHHFEDYIKFSHVLDIRQLGLDRIFYIRFSKRGTDRQYYLLFELTGPSSNIFLLDNDTRVIVQHKKTKRKRRGEKYLFNGLSIEEMEDSATEKVFQNIIDAKSPISAIEQRFKKSPLWLQELMSIEDDREIQMSFSSIIKNAKPYVLYKDKLPICISPLKITDETRRKKSFSIAVSELYEYVIREEKDERIRREIVKKIKNKEKIFEKLIGDLDKAKSSEEFKKKAELILVNLRNIKKGEKTIKLKDPYIETKLLKIEMNPAKSPIKNAEQYFKKYRKAKRSRNIVEKRMKETSKEIRNLKKLKDEIDDLSGKELTKIESIFLPQERAKEKIKIEEKKFRTFLTSEGKTVLVGRSKYENERLTFGFAKPSDLFFHIREAPGSHIILVNDGKISKDDIFEAAKIAAYFSKAKHSTIVPVSYTERKHVRRSKRLGPGKVFLAMEKTIFVEPGLPTLKEKDE